MTTFSDIGLDFPLLACDIACIDAYETNVFCCIEQREVEHGFRLGVGDYVRRTCDECDRQNFLNASDAADQSCRSCGATVGFPDRPETEFDDTYVSYDALRDGHAAITTDTEYGMISWEHAEAGMTHGVPGLEAPGMETVVKDGWTRVRLPQHHMWELLRTPNYSSWQGECWMFQKDSPMVYLGEWGTADFDAHAGGDGRRLLAELLGPDIDPDPIWDSLDGPSTLTTYVFFAPDSDEIAMHWDRT
jgi:uncharacterized protein CbrC (UPF0167 family)